ncbi:long-chain-fatty-acid--CoA ligase [Streptomyces avermitilis]|uniref:AMP-dependent synthetase n=1 Tax=Streptomyces avermitilis TaxID=33903 RepID=A0A4D4M869_STRAX|nr:long-chain fatty acid--CoA ligase [Streptomyces avermitilis]OOV21919.1 long-chain-fatty-acid--CoA ligase [Streptomyces avermitilis]BBJ56198.1 AMP-dependent synthetase [Streptomyces avermitilis]GDY68140.1 AMP-dependent synthetase [Streptomyces avermitilis]GDY71516.1 AMP-dependent synthetase [Streptomyces avermitilis]
MSLSLASVLAESAARRPDHPAIISGRETYSYRTLWRQTRQYASALSDTGVGPGDRVALLLGNQVEFPLAYFGVLALGATVVPVNALLKAHEIEYVLRDADCVAVICDGALLPEGRAAAAAAGVRLLTVRATGEPRGTSLDALAEQAEPIDRPVSREPGDLALVLYTSGTTGSPKGAMLTHLSVTMNVTIGMESPFDFRADDILLGCLPLFHTFGQICGMVTCFRAGATMVLMDRFDAPRALEIMAERGCTVLMAVPTMCIALLDAAVRDPRRPPLDRIFSGGAALPVPVLEKVEEVFDCRIYEGYGLTETSPVVAYNQRAWPCRPGTVGRPVWGVEAEIARADLEGRIELLPAEEVGEIVIRGHNVMAGYLNRPEATAEVLVDGWFRSGDLGMKDKDGYLTIVDRKKDMVLRNGYNVYPREVEEVLVHHPAIAQVSVIGLPHSTYGEEICAVVQVRPGARPGPELGAEIVSWSRERLAAYKYPRRVEFVDAFPLGPSGKILKRALRAELTG